MSTPLEQPPTIAWPHILKPRKLDNRPGAYDMGIWSVSEVVECNIVCDKQTKDCCLSWKYTYTTTP